MKLPVFNEKATCSKCGGKDIRAKYCTDGWAGEHLHRWCHRCGYEWVEACLPTEPQPGVYEEWRTCPK